MLSWWGGKGTEPVQFDEPHSIAIDLDGRLYVGDRRNKRVQVFDPKGKFLTQWNHLSTPWGVFVKGDCLYVVDGTEANLLLIVSTRMARFSSASKAYERDPVTVDANDATTSVKSTART